MATSQALGRAERLDGPALVFRPVCALPEWDVGSPKDGEENQTEGLSVFGSLLPGDPENHQFLMETNLPTPICQGLC